MGRPPKNTNHVLVRLRKAISTPTQAVTRKILAERVGISASTIREIETGKFQLTKSVAQRIMLATGVSMRSLLAGDDPLKDSLGENLAPESSMGALSDLYYQHEISMKRMLDAALTAAKEKNRANIFYELFLEWLPEALDSTGAVPTMRKVLTRNLGIFDPTHVPPVFWPKDPKTKREWENTQNELLMTVLQEAGSPDSGKIAEAYQSVLGSGRLREERKKRR